MIPSDMDLHIGVINGYNNLITIATDDLQLGRNDEVNDEIQFVEETFDSKENDFSDFLESPIPESIQESIQEPIQESIQESENLTHEDNKLRITLGGVILGFSIIWTWR